MATNKKSPYFIQIASGVYAAVQLDKDIYGSDVIGGLGISSTEPANNAVVIPMSQKTARKTGQVAIARVTVRNGTGDAEKVRQIPMVCDREKTGTANAALKDKTVTLGIASPKSWTISAVNFG